MDEELVQRVQAIYGLSSKREAIDLALRSLVGRHVQKDMLDSPDERCHRPQAR